MSRLLLISFFLLMANEILYAQDDRSQEKNILYVHSADYGVLVHTRGFGLDAQFTKQRTVNNHRLLDFGLFELKSPKEISQPNPLINGSNSYVFGKLNNLMVLNIGYGTRYVIADRNNANSIKVNFNYTLGPVLGWLKPVYYQVRIASPDGTQTSVIETKWNANNQNYKDNTVGVAPDIFKGINESFFIYGGCAKVGLNFEWGRADYKYYSLETGVMLDAFPAPVPIFAAVKNDQVFVNLYLSISYGIRK